MSQLRESIVHSPQADQRPGKESAINYSLVPVRNSLVIARLEDSKVTLYTDGKNDDYTVSQFEGVVWALLDGEHNLGDIVEKANNTLRADGIVGEQVFLDAIDQFLIRKFIRLVPGISNPLPIEIEKYTHVVSTRGGLYLVNRYEFKKIASGMFFGLTLDDAGDLFAFEFPHYKSSVWDLPFRHAKRESSNEGHVVKFSVKDGVLLEPVITHKGLANNTHDIAFHEGRLYSVDCEGQAVRVHLSQNEYRETKVFNDGGYYHINSMNFSDGKLYLMKCINARSALSSSVSIFDLEFNLLDEIHLNAERAHDIVFSEEEKDTTSFWVCDSRNGYIVKSDSAERYRVRTSPSLGIATRGLARNNKFWIVGCGYLGGYENDQYRYKGNVVWWSVQNQSIDKELPIPEMPCCILAIHPSPNIS